MSTEHSMEEVTSVTTEPTSTEDVATEKGKGKAIQEHTEGEEDSSDDDDDDDDDDDVPQVEEPEVEEDDLDEIDLSNIIQGRTRGRNIDWTIVGGEDAMDEDDDDDEEYHAPVKDDDAMKD